MDAALPAVSLTQLEALAAQAESLRSLLRDALLNDAPRIEASVFAHLRDMLAALLPRAHSAELLLYLQEILAALLFLSDESLVRSPASFAAPPALMEADSPHYVSRCVRLYCAEMFLYLCLSGVFPTQRVVAALYPMLLDLTAPPTAASPGGEGISQNRIADGIFFSSPRFHHCRVFVSATLNGILLSLPDGVFALVRVFLLEDRVEDNTTRDAAAHIARLFAEPLRHAWLCNSETAREAVRLESVSLEESVKLLSPQLMRLAVQHADDEVCAEPQKPAFLRKQDERWIRPETVEERLHLAVVTILNTALRLAPRSDGMIAFRRSYHRYSLYNRYFLTPAFGALSLRIPIRTGDDGTDAALMALRRLSTLAKGTALGASPHALLLTLEPVAPGLLELTALRDCAELPAGHLCALQELFAALWRLEAQGAVMGELFVRGAVSRVAGCLAVDRVAARLSLDFFVGPTKQQEQQQQQQQEEEEQEEEHKQQQRTLRRVAGLRAIVCDPRTPHWVCRAVLTAAAAECQRRAAERSATEHVFLCASASLGEGDELNDCDEGIALARLVEGMCLALSADALFGGTCATLDSTCDVLSAVATISFVCWRWAMLLTPHLFSPHVVCGVLSSQPSRSGVVFRRAAIRFRSVAQRMVPAAAAVDAMGAAAASEAALAAMDAAEKALESISFRDTNIYTHTDTNTDAAEVAECLRAAETAIDAGATAALAVALLRLSRVAESFASTTATATSTALATSSTSSSVGAVGSGSEVRAKVQEGLLFLLRVLFAVEDPCAAVAAVSTIVWWALARADSPDSSLIARLVIALLTLPGGDSAEAEAEAVAALRQIIPNTEGTPVGSVDRVGRLKVRVLDVLLGLCDYDTEGRTLHNMDDYSKKERHCGLYEVLAGLCRPPESAIVQVAALHLIGHYAVVIYPRVAVSAMCQLCIDVFRHTPHEMAKAACAAMLSQVTASLRTMGFLEAFGDLDFETLRGIAEAMRTYTPMKETEHAAVVRLHGGSIGESLRRTVLEEMKESVQ